MAEYTIAPADQVGPGEVLITTVAGRSLGIFNVGGTYYAIRNRCPHQGAALCLGRIVEAPIRSPLPGVFLPRDPSPWLQCPWHGWEFDLRSGESWFDPARVRVRSYPVSVEHRCRVPGDASSRTPTSGPFSAETYDARVENDYIVVTIETRPPPPRSAAASRSGDVVI